MISLQSIRLYYREKNIFFFVTASLIILILSVLIIVFRIQPYGSIVPLHYDIFFGIDRIGPWHYTLLQSLIALGIIVINFFIGYVLYTYDKHLAYFLTLAALLFNSFLLIHTITLLIFIR